VPGTSLLDEFKSRTESHKDTRNLKVDDKGRILVPQPSNSPRDPLNWPRWKKEAAYFNICFATGLIGACGPLIAPGFLQISRELGVSVNELAKTNSALLMALGVFMFFQSAIAVKYGRRPVYLAAAVLMFASNLWSYGQPNIPGLTGSRILQGMAMAPVESIATATIADLYFVHQRGIRAAVWGLSLLGGINVAPIVNGFIITSIGWRYCFAIIAPFYGLSLIGFIFFSPETVFDRTSALEVDQGHAFREAQIFEEKEEVQARETVDTSKPVTHVPNELESGVANSIHLRNHLSKSSNRGRDIDHLNPSSSVSCDLSPSS